MVNIRKTHFRHVHENYLISEEALNLITLIFLGRFKINFFFSLSTVKGVFFFSFLNEIRRFWWVFFVNRKPITALYDVIPCF